MTFRKISAYLLILAAALATLSAQTGNGIVNGTVQDASGSLVPNAQVTLTEQQTNIQRRTASSSVGAYYFGEVPPGPYKLLVESAGFEKWEGAFVLEAGQKAEIQPKLVVGNVESVVEVSSAAPVITTEGMQIADVKDELRIHQLPLNGRSVANLFNLTPGVEGGGAPRVNGMKVGSTGMLMDGISIGSRYSGGIADAQPGLDTVQEFRIETNGSSARYANPATVNLVSKGGTNQVHGSAFETLRNNGAGLRARARQDGSTAAKLIRNEFGASVGGPVVLPKLYDGHNRTFFFVAYEGMRQRQSTFDEDYVPTTQMWAGNFSNVLDNNNVATHIYDPLTTNAQGLRTPFVGDIVPQSRISPFYGTMQSITHTPTSGTDPFQAPNLDLYYPLNGAYDTVTTRIDHTFSPRDMLSGRFTRAVTTSKQFGGLYGSPKESMTNGFGTGLRDSRMYNLALNETHTFSPTLLNSLLVAASRNPNHYGTLADSTQWADKLGLPNPFGASGWPTIYAGNFNGGWDSDNPRDQNLTTYVIENNVTKVWGTHTMNFGGSIHREYNYVRELQQAQGSHDFAEDWTSQYDPIGDQAVSYTGIGLASMAQGLPTYLSDQYNRGYFYFKQTNGGLYYEDSWRASRRLTLQLGLRWEKWTPYQEKYNRLVNVDVRSFANQFQVVTPGNTTIESIQGIPPSVLSSWAARGLTWTTANKAGLPSALIPSSNTDFGPRLGMAYRINDKTVLRAGFGEYFWTLPLSQILATSRTNPPLNLRYVLHLNSLDGTSSYAIRTTPQPSYYIGQAKVDINGNIIISPNAQSMIPFDFTRWNDSSSRQWNFTIEREILRNTSLRISYIGSHGSNMEQRIALNNQESQYNYVARTSQTPPSNRDLLRVNPDWNFSNGMVAKAGYSNSSLIQLQVEHRYASGLALQWFYTFSRVLTTTDAGGAASGNGGINDTNTGTSSGVSAQAPENIQLLGEPNLSFDQRLRLTYFNSAQVPAHHIGYNGVYDLPFGRGKRFAKGAGRGLDALIGGWQVATIGNWRSGFWTGVNNGEYLFGNPVLSSGQRLTLYLNGRPQLMWFKGDFDPTLATNVNLQALEALVSANRGQRVLHPLGTAYNNQVPQTLANGSVRNTSITDTLNWNARNFFLGPQAWNADISVFKNFSVTEKLRLRLTADAFNAFNHPNNASPNSTTGLVDLSTQTNEPRVIQLSARLTW